MSAKDRINCSDPLHRSGYGSAGLWNACVAMKRVCEKSEAKRLKSAAAKCLFSLVLVMLLLVVAPPAAADTPEIDIDVDHEEADTWSSVLVIIRMPPVVGENNTTYHVNRKITIVLKDLDTPEILFTNTNLTLFSGIATFNFRILPEWGEFLLAVDVFDAYTRAEGRALVKVVYSIDYAIYLLAVRFDHDVAQIKESNDASDAHMSNMALFMFLIVFILLPVALLRLDHKSARQLGNSSMWDKAQDKYFNWTLVATGLHHYLEDPGYEFRALGKRAFHERRLSYSLDALKVDQMALSKVESSLNDELKEFESDEWDEPDLTSRAMAAAVARAIYREMKEEVEVVDETAMHEADAEERLAGEEEDE